ncbi:MAG: hypothetical protein N3D72_01080, partial [Candidatus Methanomethyliaceae archaeon]|nr:hypothetical protein [Candidatus Methanomethyliaceae archaeon]
IKLEDPFNHNVAYKIFDSMKITLPDGEIHEHIPLEKDTMIAIIGGENIGKYGKILEVPTSRKPMQLARILLEGNERTVTLKYAFPIGRESPSIMIGGVV